MKYIKRILLSSVLVLFIIIEAGTFSNFSMISYGNDRYHSTEFSIAVIVGAVFLCALLLLFRRIGCIDRKKQKYITLLLWAIFFAVSFFFIFSIDYRPDTDSMVDIDMGWYLSRQKLAPNAHTYWLNIYGNNYLLIFLFKWLAVLARLLRVQNNIRYLLVFNLLCISLGIFLTWKIVCLKRGIEKANRVLLLVILNPLIYYLIFWVYSSSVSIPIMMGIFYLMVLLQNETVSAKKKTVFGILAGILTAVGWFIRPTAIFPFIACIFYILLFNRELCKRKSFWLIAALVIVSGMISFAGINQAVNNTFSEARKNNYPLSRWIYMGSMGNGDLTTADEDDGFDVEKAVRTENMSLNEAYRKGTIYNYKKMGIAGSANLWIRKTMTTFSDAYSFVVNRIFTGTYSGTIFEILKRPLGKTYAYLYRIDLYLGILLCLLFLHAENKSDVVTALSVLTLAGGLLFNFIWECKGDYALVYMMIMAVLSAEGFDFAGSKIKQYRFHPVNLHLSAILLLIVFITLNEWTILAEPSVTNYNRIDGNNRHRCNDHTELKLDDNNEINQSFLCKKTFNTIVIQAETDNTESPKTERSSYRISVSGNRGQSQFETVIDSSDLTDDNNIVLKTGNIHDASGHFVITIKKISSGREALKFFTAHNYYFDSYDGTLKFGGQTYSDDLSMQVMQAVSGPLIPFAWRMALILIIDGMILIVWIGMHRTYQMTGKK